LGINKRNIGPVESAYTTITVVIAIYFFANSCITMTVLTAFYAIHFTDLDDVTKSLLIQSYSEFETSMTEVCLYSKVSVKCYVTC